MENKYLVLLLLNSLIIIGGFYGSSIWQEYDYQKCLDIQDNDYYYTMNNCWTTMENPVGNQIMMFILITIFPLMIINTVILLLST